MNLPPFEVMKTVLSCLTQPLLPVSLLVAFGAARTFGASPVPLPGARPAVEAARYPSLQAALDALPDEGGLVRLPPGTFPIRQPLVLSRPDTLLQGAGAATHIQNLNEEGQPALLVQHSQGRKVKASDRLWRIQLSQFRLTGNPKSGHGIEAIQIEEIFIQGVTVSHHGGHGIFLDQCYEDPRISDCLITYNKRTGLQLQGCHDIVVSANQFEENLDAVQCLDGFNLCMTGNNLDDHLRHGVVIENTYGSVVCGNMIEECRGAAILLDRDCYGNNLGGNVIAHNGQGIVLQDAHGCAIGANTFTINQQDAVKIGPQSGRISVTGNNFSNSYIGEDRVKRGTNDLAAAGLTLEGTSDVVVSGNLFSSLRPKALAVTGQPARRVLFSNNLLIDAPSDDGRLERSTTDQNLRNNQ